MNCSNYRGTQTPLTPRHTALWALVAVGAFHGAYADRGSGVLMVAHLLAMATLGLWGYGSARQAFYSGLAIGLVTFGPQLSFFWGLFGATAVALWLVLSFWTGLFLLLARQCRMRLGAANAALLLPALWTGIEYFRSELYLLRFAWLTPGYALSRPDGATAHHFDVGVYGTSFVVLLVIGISIALGLSTRRLRNRVLLGGVLVVGLMAFQLFVGVPRHWSRKSDPTLVPVAGVQLEVPGPDDLRRALDRILENHPRTELIVLSEYTFGGPVPEYLSDWCRRNRRYVIAGGKEPVSASQFRNTAFVVGPDGRIVFKQAKAVPIQFFNDGLPAPELRVWESPWGKFGICICYDLSFTRVTDELIRQGAVALIVPTMDLVEWGRHQHELHARVAPARASEYRVAIFRVASSGISQLVNRYGDVTAIGSFPGQGEMIAGDLELRDPGMIPLDRWLAPGCVSFTAGVLVWLVWTGRRSLIEFRIGKR